MAEFVARFYSISKCGYYPYPADSDPELGGFEYLLEELHQWSADKTLDETRLPMPTSTFPTYLMSIDKRAGCWVLVLWNEVPSSEGAVASVSRNSRVGHPTIHENAIVDGSIPGFPTYFVCLADEELVATLKHGDRVTGLQAFKNYLSVFQEIATSAAVVDMDDDDPTSYQVIGYMDEDEVVRRLHARFQVQVKRSGQQRAAILARSASIRKIIRVKEMDPRDRVDLQLYQRGLVWLGMAERPLADKIKFRQEIEIHPTRDEVAAVIDSMTDEVEPRINDVGFVFKGEVNPLWLSGSIPSENIEIDTQAEDGVFNATSMVNVLSRRKAALVAAADK